MITYTTGDLLASKAEALIIAVNTVGVMGKGIALRSKQQFPEMYKLYKSAADRKELQVGKVQVVSVQAAGSVKYIINFPTKQHWRFHPK